MAPGADLIESKAENRWWEPFFHIKISIPAEAPLSATLRKTASGAPAGARFRRASASRRFKQAQAGSSRQKRHVTLLAERGCDIDKGIERETRNPAAQQVADARLSHMTTRRRLGLRPLLLADQSGYLIHQLRTQAQIDGFFRGVRNGIPHAPETLRFGFFSLSCLTSHQLGKPRFDHIDIPLRSCLCLFLRRMRHVDHSVGVI